MKKEKTLSEKKKPEEFDELILGDKRLEKNKRQKKLKKGDVLKYFVSKVCPFSNSGAYIPCSEEYKGHKVYVIVLEGKDE